MAETCMSCNRRCENCNSCLGENVCKIQCNTCQVDQDRYPCMKAQTICENTNVLRRLIGSFTFNPSPMNSNTRIGKKTGDPDQDQYIFDRESWYAICRWIDARQRYGSGDLAKNDGPFPDYDSRIGEENLLSHQAFQRVANELGAGLTVNRDDVIYGSYFKKLEDAAYDYTISNDCCYYCNTQCNTNCDDCVHCVICQGNCNRGMCSDTPTICSTT